MAKIVHSCFSLLAVLITGCITASEDEVGTPVDGPAQAARSEEAAIPGLPRRCFSSSLGQIISVDLARQTIAPTLDHIESIDISSLGLIQNHLVACASYEGQIAILDLATGFTHTVEMPCTGVTAVGDRIYVQTLVTDLREYASLRALIANQPTRILPPPYASRVGAGNGRLLAAWHSADEVLAVDLDTAATTPIHLPDYDGWIFGLYENARVRLVAGGWVEKGLNVYDAASGQPIARLFPDTWLEGLACTP
jgi:hypothetical protein